MGEISFSGIEKDSVYKDAKAGEYFKVIGVASSLLPKVTSQFVVCQSLQYQSRFFICEVDIFKYKIAIGEIVSSSSSGSDAG